jgi:hypothetical protein
MAIRVLPQYISGSLLDAHPVMDCFQIYFALFREIIINMMRNTHVLHGVGLSDICVSMFSNSGIQKREKRSIGVC